MYPCFLWKSKKKSICSGFYPHQDVCSRTCQRNKDPLSCPLWYKDILILQLPLRMNSFHFRELMVQGLRADWIKFCYSNPEAKLP